MDPVPLSPPGTALEDVPEARADPECLEGVRERMGGTGEAPAEGAAEVMAAEAEAEAEAAAEADPGLAGQE